MTQVFLICFVIVVENLIYVLQSQSVLEIKKAVVKTDFTLVYRSYDLGKG